MPVEALRALVVGTGFGCRIQVPAFRGAGYDVVGLVGSDPARTAQRAAANGIAAQFTDLGEAIAATRPDVVAISTTPHTHGPLTLQALAAGCHVLCEKPFARDSNEARQMLAAAEKAGKVHMLGNEFRYTEQRSTTTRLISDGALGEPRFASFVQVGDFIRAWQDDFPDWWFDPAQGGGWLGASSSHWIDQIRVWLGEFDSLSATLNAVTLSRGPVEDTFTLRFTMQSGLEGVLQQCAGAYGPMFESNHIAGSKGHLWFDFGGVHIADANGERDVPVPADLQLPAPPPLTADPRNQRIDWQSMAYVEIAPYTELCKSMAAAIRGEQAPSPVVPATFADGVAHMQVLDAIRMSARNGGALVRVAAM
jgi:predicted dehydrogenase